MNNNLFSLNSNIDISINSSQDLVNQYSKNDSVSTEKKNIQSLILYRALYILKQTFSKHKQKIKILYQQYKDGPKDLLCLNLNHLVKLLINLFNVTNIKFIKYKKFNEILTADLLINDDLNLFIIKELIQFIYKNIYKYNRIFYDKKVKEREIKIKQMELENIAKETKKI